MAGTWRGADGDRRRTRRGTDCDWRARHGFNSNRCGMRRCADGDRSAKRSFDVDRHGMRRSDVGYSRQTRHGATVTVVAKITIAGAVAALLSSAISPTVAAAMISMADCVGTPVTVRVRAEDNNATVAAPVWTIAPTPLSGAAVLTVTVLVLVAVRVCAMVEVRGAVVLIDSNVAVGGTAVDTADVEAPLLALAAAPLPSAFVRTVAASASWRITPAPCSP